MSVIYKSLKNAQREPGGNPRPRAAVSALEDEGAPRFRTWAFVVAGVIAAGGATAYGVKNFTPAAQRMAEPGIPQVVVAEAPTPTVKVAEAKENLELREATVRVNQSSVTGHSSPEIADEEPTLVEQTDRPADTESGVASGSVKRTESSGPKPLTASEEEPPLTVGRRIFSGDGDRPISLVRATVSRDEPEESEPVRAAEPTPAPKPEPKVSVVNNRDEGRRLVVDLRAAMARNDRAATEELFQRLESLRGREDTFLLKLKGFWHISNNEPREAEQALSRVLARLPDDLDANLNMALIESRTGRMSEAKYRAERLRSRYPGDQRVQELGRLFR